MFLQATSISGADFGPVGLRCPRCRREGTFDRQGQDFLIGGSYMVGHRICPNTECKTHVSVVVDTQSRDLGVSYPPQRIDFDSTDIPAGVLILHPNAEATKPDREDQTVTFCTNAPAGPN